MIDDKSGTHNNSLLSLVYFHYFLFEDKYWLNIGILYFWKEIIEMVSYRFIFL